MIPSPYPSPQGRGDSVRPVGGKEPTVDEKRGKYTGMLMEWLEEITAVYMADLKMTPDNARSAAELALATIQAHSAGCASYIAKGHLWAVTEKHRRIYRRFTGANHGQLAREFGLTERQVYTIIERVGREEFERKQIKLFGDA